MAQVYAEAVKSVAELGKTEAGQAAMKQAATDAGKITDVALKEIQTGEAVKKQSEAAAHSVKTVTKGVEKGSKNVLDTAADVVNAPVRFAKNLWGSVTGTTAEAKAKVAAIKEAEQIAQLRSKALEAGKTLAEVNAMYPVEGAGKSLIEGAMESSYAGGFLDVKRPNIMIALIIIFVLFCILFCGYLYTGEQHYRTWLLNTGLLFGTVFVLDQLI